MRRALVLVCMLAAFVAIPAARQPASAATCHPSLKSLTLLPASVPGGATVTARAAVSCHAPKRLAISLAGFRGVSVPAVLHVSRGSNTGSATISTSVARATRRGVIMATLGGVRRRAALTVTRTPRSCRRPSLTALAAPALVYVGTDARIALSLSCAPTAPIRVSVTSSDSFLPAPGKVTIGRYYDYAIVLLKPRADEAGQFKATITVRYGPKTLRRTITVDPGLASVDIPACSEPNCVFPDVLFTGVLPAGGATVRLASNNSAVTVPATATFQAGSLGGGFTGVTVHQVSKDTKVTISATFGGRTMSASTVLVPPFTNGDTVTLSAESGSGPIYGQEFSLEYIALLSNPAPAGGETVNFTTTDPSIELQNTSWDVTPGFDDAYVNINTADVTSPVHAKLEAAVAGTTATATVNITIEPDVASISTPATVVGGDSFPATVNLAGPVDTNTTVFLQSLEGILTVPLSVTVEKGQSSATFTASTTTVSSDTAVSFEATLGMNPGTNPFPSNTIMLTP